MITCTVLEKLQAPQLATVPHIVWNPKVNYPVHKSPPHVHILRQIDLVHALPSYSFNIYFNIILHLHVGLPSGYFRQVSHQNPVGTSPLLIRVTCSANHILLYTRHPNIW
jgi:hypothetical protein